MPVWVTAPSRLHFGLIAVGDGGGRRFGGCGLMIADPGVRVRAEFGDECTISGPSFERAGAVVWAVAKQLAGGDDRSVQVTVERCPDEHVGLGTGTQLTLAVVKAVAELYGVSLTAERAAELTSRGKRSAIGLHGFSRGGFLVDGGRTGDGPAPLIARHDFPAAWRVLLVRPPSRSDEWTGPREAEAFAHLTGTDPTLGERMCRLLVLGVLPALVERDCAAFGETLHEYNRLAGRAFAPVQGGDYSSPAVAGLIERLRAMGVRGVGQSSWGPTVFAVTEDAGRAARVAEALTKDALAVTITAANNVGAIW
jgi:beta-ribofuranosylaminobenzene 5'-phosphate synthase